MLYFSFDACVVNLLLGFGLGGLALFTMGFWYGLILFPWTVLLYGVIGVSVSLIWLCCDCVLCVRISLGWVY